MARWASLASLCSTMPCTAPRHCARCGHSPWGRAGSRSAAPAARPAATRPPARAACRPGSAAHRPRAPPPCRHPQAGHGLLHGVAGAQLRLLAHKLQVKCACSACCTCGSRFYFCSAMAGDDDGAARLQVRGLVQHMVQQGRPARRCSTLGMRLFMRVPLPAAMMRMSMWCHGGQGVSC
jgi:hypothetical protein